MARCAQWMLFQVGLSTFLLAWQEPKPSPPSHKPEAALAYTIVDLGALGARRVTPAPSIIKDRLSVRQRPQMGASRHFSGKMERCAISAHSPVFPTVTRLG